MKWLILKMSFPRTSEPEHLTPSLKWWTKLVWWTIELVHLSWKKIFRSWWSQPVKLCAGAHGENFPPQTLVMILGIWQKLGNFQWPTNQPSGHTKLKSFGCVSEWLTNERPAHAEPWCETPPFGECKSKFPQNGHFCVFCGCLSQNMSDCMIQILCWEPLAWASNQ